MTNDEAAPTFGLRHSFDIRHSTLQAQWLKLAVAIQAAGRNRQAPQVSIELPAVDWQLCQSLARRIEKSRQRGWRRSVPAASS